MCPIEKDQLSVKDISDDHILLLLNSNASYERGFRCLMEKYQERMYWHIRRLVVVHEDANDVIQNTFIKVYKGIKNFKGNSKLYTWLFRIATNEAITFLNKKKKNLSESLDDENSYLENQLKADEYFDGNAIQIHLKKALNSLPQKQRIVFCMRYYDEMSYKEISEALETSEGALKASYHHAAKKIETYFKEVEL